jgi:hypothetical protein
MSLMSSQTKRLEWGIVATVLLVLFLCRQPPQSGNAGLHGDAAPMQQGAVPETQNGGQQPPEGTFVNLSSAAASPRTSDPDASPQWSARRPSVVAPRDAGTPDNGLEGLPIPARPATKRLGMVDARQCPRLNYPDILYGEVTARWVWDGHRWTLHKVIEVREPSGAISTWNFDDHDEDVILKELAP